MRVRVLAFARLRELLGSGELILELPERSTLESLSHELARRNGAITPLLPSTRFARNGRIVAGSEPLAEHDEIALLPPAGGG